MHLLVFRSKQVVGASERRSDSQIIIFFVQHVVYVSACGLDRCFSAFGRQEGFILFVKLIISEKNSFAGGDTQKDGRFLHGGIIFGPKGGGFWGHFWLR
jgi:hypothetical protein